MTTPVGLRRRIRVAWHALLGRVRETRIRAPRALSFDALWNLPWLHNVWSAFGQLVHEVLQDHRVVGVGDVDRVLRHRAEVLQPQRTIISQRHRDVDVCHKAPSRGRVILCAEDRCGWRRREGRNGRRGARRQGAALARLSHLAAIQRVRGPRHFRCVDRKRSIRAHTLR